MQTLVCDFGVQTLVCDFGVQTLVCELGQLVKRVKSVFDALLRRNAAYNVRLKILPIFLA